MENGINLFLSSLLPWKCTRLIISKPSLNDSAKLTVYHREHIRSGNKRTIFQKRATLSRSDEEEQSQQSRLAKIPWKMSSVCVIARDMWSERIYNTRHFVPRFAAYITRCNCTFSGVLYAPLSISHFHPHFCVNCISVHLVNAMPVVRIKLLDAEINPIDTVLVRGLRNWGRSSIGLWCRPSKRNSIIWPNTRYI